MNPEAALLASDRRRIRQLLTLEPGDSEVIDAARLLMRYGNNSDRFGADLAELLAQVLQRWGLSREQLHARTRSLWASGWRPVLDPSVQTDGVAVGSGADTVGS